jgi:hypothetical protein
LFSASLGQIIIPFGFDATSATFTLFSVLLTGMIGVVGAGVYVKNTGKFKSTIVMLCLGFLLSLLGFMLILNLENNFLLYLFGAMLGMFLAPSLTIGIELACEVGFPVGESYSNGFI